jgi:rRNA maturation protein Rpf1
MQVISEIIESCRSHDITDLILVHEHRGQPDGLIVSHLPNGPTAYFGLLNVVGVLNLFGSIYMLRCCVAQVYKMSTQTWLYP